MKKEKYPLLIYRDEKFEEETRDGLKLTFDAYVKLLDIWNSLNIGECSDIFTLATFPARVYAEAFNSSLNVPAEIGGFHINKTAFINIIEVPTPNELYVQAKAVLKSPGYGYTEVFSIKDGIVVQDEEKAEEIIHSRNIYAHNEHQEELGKACIEYIRLSNYIDEQFKIIPWQYIPAPPWTLVGKSFPHLAMLSLEVEQLRIIMNKL